MCVAWTGRLSGESGGRFSPLKFRKAGEFRDIPLPQYVSEAIDKHVAEHGTSPDGYLFQGRKYKLVVRRSYQQDFQRAAARAGLPPNLSRTHCPPVRLYQFGRGHPDHRGLPLARPQEHRGHAPDLRHLVPSSFDRARIALNHAYQESRGTDVLAAVSLPARIKEARSADIGPVGDGPTES